MSKADYIRRKWMKLFHNGNHTHIITFLQVLGVITESQRNTFLSETSMAYSNWWQRQAREDNKLARRSYSKRPPKIIRPTGARR